MTLTRCLAMAVAVVTTIPAAVAARTAQHDGHGQTAAPTTSATTVARARADIAGKDISGTVELAELKAGTATWVQVTVKAKGLTPGLHGVHLHAVGACSPDFTAAGGHFDPGPASNTDPDANHPFHMGDLPNLEVAASGEGMFVATTTRVTISDGPLSLFDTDGTAVILHGNPDKGVTGEPKSGVSGGPRVACGVLKKM